MPKYDNQINWSGGFKFGQGQPSDDRFIFVDIADGNDYIANKSFFIYEGLWAWFQAEDNFYYARRVNTALPYDSVTNPYMWIPQQGIPSFGDKDQQLVADPSGFAQWQFATQRNLHKFEGVVASNGLSEGLFILHTGLNTFEDMHNPANYTLSNPSRLPVYFIFKVVGDDIWVGKYGVYNTGVTHDVVERQPLYFNTQYITGGTYYENVLTPTPSAIIGEINYQGGIALDETNILIDLTQGWKAIENPAGGGTGNAFIFRVKIQKFGNGGIAGITVGTETAFTLPHGFGSSIGVVQVIDLGVDGLLPGALVQTNNVTFLNGEVIVNVDYGIVDDTSILEVVLIF